MEALVVKKQKSHRILIRCLAALGCTVFLFLLFVSQDPLLNILVLMTQLPIVLLLFYFESWAIVFRGKETQKRCWGRQKSYTWTEIQEVAALRSATEGPYVLIRFRDGKKFRFRLEDENGIKAVALIKKHTSIVSGTSSD